MSDALPSPEWSTTTTTRTQNRLLLAVVSRNLAHPPQAASLKIHPRPVLSPTRKLTRQPRPLCDERPRPPYARAIETDRVAIPDPSRQIGCRPTSISPLAPTLTRTNNNNSSSSNITLQAPTLQTTLRACPKCLARACCPPTFLTNAPIRSPSSAPTPLSPTPSRLIRTRTKTYALKPLRTLRLLLLPSVHRSLSGHRRPAVCPCDTHCPPAV